MNEYFVNTTDSYIPTYKPGCAAYGQDGTNANTGETGSSVYYSSIDFSNIFTSDKSTLSKINSLIKSGKPLSNNDILVKNENDRINYKPNDIIIDSTGSFYYLDEALSVKSCDFDVEVKSELAKNIKNFNVYCTTKYYNSAKIKNETQNVFINNDVTSYKFIHNDSNSDKLYGNYIKFDLNFESSFDYSKFIFKYVLILPDGRVLEHYNNAASDVIFIENRLLFNCVDSLTKCDMASITMQKIKDSLEEKNQWNDLSVVTPDEHLNKTLKELLSYDGVSNNGLSSKSISIIMSYVIRNNCYAYVEILDKETGEMFRLNVDDITLKNNNNNQDSNVKNDYIIETTDIVKWSANIFEYPPATYLKNKNDNSLFYPFISYVMFNNETPQDFKMSENDMYANFYFTNAGGLAYHLAHNFTMQDTLPDKDIIDHYRLSDINETKENVLAFSHNNNDYTLSDRNRTYKLFVTGVKKISITISFTPYSSFAGEVKNLITGDKVYYPNSIVYIGCPDIPLIDYNYTPDDSSVGKIGCINYYIKFIPPTYENHISDDNVRIANAGVANVTIDLTEFGINDNKKHFIEIGLSLIENIRSLKLDYNTTPVSLQNDEYQTYGKKYKLSEYLNSLHRQSIFADGVINNMYYKFIDSKLVDDNASLNEMQTDDVNTMPSNLSGIPDVKMYISNIEEFSDYNSSSSTEQILTPRYRDIPKY